MTFNKVFILSTLFIFCIIPSLRAGEIQSINNIPDIVKMNRGKNEASLITNPLFSNESSPSLLKSEENKLKRVDHQSQFKNTMGVKKQFQWIESFNKAIFFLGLSPYSWKEKYFNARSTPKMDSSKSAPSSASIKPSPSEIEPFNRIDPFKTLKFLQTHQAAIFKDVFIGLCFSVEPMSGHITLGIKAAPPSDKEGGVVITF